MPVEQIAVGLGTSSHYDTVSATIRGKTVPQNGQNFTVDLSGTAVNFEIEDAEETPRSGAESSYSVSGRELRSEFLYRAVDFTMQMPYNSSKGAFSLPTASEIVGCLGLSVVYDAPNFTPTVAGMGWKTEYTGSNGSYTCKVRIREKNIQSLLEKLFSWTAEFGKRKICWHIRQGTLYIWELQRATGQSMTVTLGMCPKDKLKIKKSRIRKFSEITDTSSSGVSTPTNSFVWDYGDVPFSGTIIWGGASRTFSNGYLAEVVAVETGRTRTESYSYGTYLNAVCMTRKTVVVKSTKETSGGTVTTTQTTITDYTYTKKREGVTTGSGRDVPVLSSEVTVNTKSSSDSGTSTEIDKTVVEYSPLGNGHYGITAIRYVNGEVDQMQTSVANESPMSAASQYTLRQIVGWHIDGTSHFPGYVLAPTRLPIESSDLADEYLTEFKNLHGAIEQTISAEVVGQAALNPIQGKIVYNGVEYYVTDVSINWTSASRRMSVAGIRWDYDFAYRKNILGFDEDD